MIPPALMYQMAQERQAELLRQTGAYRRAGPTVRMGDLGVVHIPEASLFIEGLSPIDV